MQTTEVPQETLSTVNKDGSHQVHMHQLQKSYYIIIDLKKEVRGVQKRHVRYYRYIVIVILLLLLMLLFLHLRSNSRSFRNQE